jgi:hypothetical protein
VAAEAGEPAGFNRGDAKTLLIRLKMLGEPSCCGCFDGIPAAGAGAAAAGGSMGGKGGGTSVDMVVAENKNGW